jgi:hypothetical protein
MIKDNKSILIILPGKRLKTGSLSTVEFNVLYGQFR